MKPRMYYLDESIDQILDQSVDTKEQARESIKEYFKQFSEDEILELLIRGQIHAQEDKRTGGYFDK